MFLRHKPSQAPTPEQVPPEQAKLDYFRLHAVRFYQPDDELRVRLPNGVGKLAAFSKTLAWVGTEYFGRLCRDFGSLGVLIAVGVRPGNQVKLWCDLVDGHVPADLWDVFVDLLAGAGVDVRPDVTAPVAFALECLVGHGPREDFPLIPVAWQQAAATTPGGLSLPDELFEIVFPA